MGFDENIAKLVTENKTRDEQLEEAKEVWIHEVGILYKEIENWFSEYIERGDISLEHYSLGSAEYAEFLQHIKIMELTLGRGPVVVLEPIGINVANGFGKIEMHMQGHVDERMFLMLISCGDKDFCWELWKNNEQKMGVFSKEMFKQVMNKWIEKWA